MKPVVLAQVISLAVPSDGALWGLEETGISALAITKLSTKVFT